MFDYILDSSLNVGIKTVFLLLLLVALEAVLSADNAVAIAAIAGGIEDPKKQRDALNFGLVAAYVLRITLIFTATWVINFWQFQLAGAAYLLWLVFKYFTAEESDEEENRTLKFASVWQAIPIIAVTDLAFSLDSVTTAIAISDETWLVIVGGTIGVITLRFLAELFIGWLKEYKHLEDAGFLTVGLVGLRLLLKVIKPEFIPPEWVMISAIILVFAWGFSQKNEPASPEEAD